MKPRVTVITLGVDDLETSLRFYRDGLGLTTQGIVGTEFPHGAIVFFDLQGGAKLSLWPRKSIVQEVGVPESSPSQLEVTLAHNVASKAEVDSVMEEAKNAGATILKPAQDTFWGGYSGYFADPDQHIWEVAWNPDWEVSE
jgi:catechol 2,3-dioxygenase-like lactoylglutathione lyase family enzyme